MNRKGIKEKFAKLFDDPNRVTFKDSLNNITGEYEDLEFKENEIEPQILAKHILGIANTLGGIICLGIEETDNGLKPKGLEKNSDVTPMKQKLGNYLPPNLKYDIHPIDYDKNEEWKELRNKSFKIITIEYTPEYLPFMPIKSCDLYEKTDIFCRKHSNTERCEYEDLQKILNKRIKTLQNQFNLEKELKELELLMSYEIPQKQIYYTLYNRNFLNKISEFREKKEKIIEKGLKIDEC